MKKFFKVLAIVVCFGMLASSVVPNVGVEMVEAKNTVKLNYTKKTITPGDSFKLKLKGANGKVTWKSSNKKVATVNAKGKVTGEKKGTSKITAIYGGKKYTCKVNVKVKYGSISGNITYHYNQYKGYVADTGAKIYILDENTSKIVGKATADGNGDYTIQHIPTGSYTVLISSKECKSEDVLYGTEVDDFYEEYGEYLNIAGTIYYEYDVSVYEKETTTVSYAFSYTDF